jgi:hypothetical protein
MQALCCASNIAKGTFLHDHSVSYRIPATFEGPADNGFLAFRAKVSGKSHRDTSANFTAGIAPATAADRERPRPQSGDRREIRWLPGVRPPFTVPG